MNTVLKYPGSKWSMSGWIISHFPNGYEKMTYLEPYMGSLAVFFQKNRSAVETVNDLDGNVVNLFRVIRDRPEELARLVEFTPWSRDEYRISYQQSGDELEDARRFLVRMWMAIGAKSSDSTGWRNNIKSINGNCAQWASMLPSNILSAAKRLKHGEGCLVQIENQDALTLIERYRRGNVLIYADPPYVMSTRSKRIYACEMNDGDHVKLLETLEAHPGPVIISGYASELYDKRLDHWMRETRKTRSESGKSREEVLWINPVAAKQVERRLFM